MAAMRNYRRLMVTPHNDSHSIGPTRWTFPDRGRLDGYLKAHSDSRGVIICPAEFPGKLIRLGAS